MKNNLKMDYRFKKHTRSEGRLLWGFGFQYYKDIAKRYFSICKGPYKNIIDNYKYIA